MEKGIKNKNIFRIVSFIIIGKMEDGIRNMEKGFFIVSKIHIKSLKFCFLHFPFSIPPYSVLSLFLSPYSMFSLFLFSIFHIR